MLLDAFLRNAQNYKVEQSWERGSALLYTWEGAIEKGVFESPSTTVDQLIYIYVYIAHWDPSSVTSMKEVWDQKRDYVENKYMPVERLYY